MVREGLGEQRALGVAFVLALAMHASLLVVRPKVPAVSLPSATAEVEISVEAAEDLPALPPEAVAPTEPLEPQAGAVAEAESPLAAMMPAPTSASAAPPAEVAPAPTPTSASSAGAWSAPLLAGPTREDIGLSGSNAFYKYSLEARDAGPAPVARAPDVDANRRTRDALRQPLREADRAHGLGAGGPVMTALEDATRAGALPADCRATFDVRIDGTGHVVSIGLVGASADRATFESIAKSALAALAPKRARVPAGSQGALLRVEVISQFQSASGGKPGSPVRLGVGGGSFDLADIGAKPSVVVAARVTSERVIE